MTGELGADLQKVSRLLARVQPTTIAYRAAEFVEDFRSKLEETHPEEAKNVEWQTLLDAEEIEIDPQLLQTALLELFDNAFTHERAEGIISFIAQAAGDTIEFRLREPKQQFQHHTENWGVTPLIRIRHGHYGLGLFRARSILEAHHGS